MKFCTIKRNDSGKITRVNNPDGSESKLFTRIAQHPLVKDTEEAANIFKNTFTRSIKNLTKLEKLDGTQRSRRILDNDKQPQSSGEITYEKGSTSPEGGKLVNEKSPKVGSKVYYQSKEYTVGRQNGDIITISDGRDEFEVSSDKLLSEVEATRDIREFDLKETNPDNVNDEALDDAVFRGFRDLNLEPTDAEVTGTSAFAKVLMASEGLNLETAIKEAVGTFKKAGKSPVSVKTNPEAAGSNTTTPNTTYNESVNNNGDQLGTNLWVRQSEAPTNEGRTLLVQFASTLLYGKDNFNRSISSKFFDGLYRLVKGYDRTSDFWEVPLWMSRVAGMESDSDVYVIRDIDEANKFIAEAGYDRVLFSALDVNQARIMDIVKNNKAQQFNIGGYSALSDFSGLENVTTFDSMEAYAKSRGIDDSNVYSYRHFSGTKIIPRLKMSEGCRYKCAFCSIPKKVVTMPREEIMAMVDSIVELDATLVYLDDKTFGQASNYDMLPEIYEKIKEYNPDFEGFIIQTTSIDFANTEKFSPEFLEKSGIKLVELGIETYNDDILTKLRKQHSHKRFTDAAMKNARDNGIKVIPNVIIGLTWKEGAEVKTEDKESYLRTLQFLQNNEDIISHINVYSLALYEGTELGDSIEAKEEADKNENIVSKSWQKNKEVHQWAMDNFSKFALTQLENTHMQPENPESGVTFTHRLPNGKIVNSYRDVLRLTKEGDTIEVGLMVDGNFSPIVLARRNTNKNTEQGYINNQIVTGLISDQKTKVGVDYVYQIGGETDLAKALNMVILRDDADAYLGHKGLQVDGNTFKVEKTRGKISVMTNGGDLIVLDQDEIDGMTYEEIKGKFDSHIEIIASREWAASKVAYREQEPVVSQRTPVQSEAELQVRLLNFLNKLGVKTMSISEYVKKYKMKNGVNPSAKALADIANQVVAYAKGDTESLSEEVAHFINEAFPKEQVNNILRNIHKTSEWAEFNQQYREIYSKEYSGAELEDVVRREVLGKIVAKVISNQVVNEQQTETQKNIFERTLDAIKALFEKIKSRLTPQYDSELSQYLSEVEDMLSAEDIGDYVNINNFKNSTIRLYNVGNSNTNVDKLRKTASLLAAQLQDVEKRLIGAGSGSKLAVKELIKVQNDLEHALEEKSILSLISMVNSNVRALNAAIKDSEAKNKSYFLSDEESIVYQNIKQVSGKAIAEVQALLIKIKQDTGTRQWDEIINELKDTSGKIVQLEAKANLIDSQNVKKLVDRIMDKYPIAAENRELVEKWIEKAESDTNLFHSTFGQLVHAKDGLLNLSGNIIRNMHLFAHERFYHSVKNYQDKLKELGVSESDIGKEFVDGQYILSEYDFNRFNNAIDLIYVQAYKEVVTKALTDPKTEPSKIARYTELSNMSLEELIAVKNARELEVLSLNEETSQKNLQRPLTAALIERTMIDSYYNEYEEKLSKANINDVTKQKLSDYLSAVSALKKKAYRKIGDKTVLDYSSLSEFDREKLSDLHKGRKMMKSFTDETGRLKTGLKYIRVNGEFKIDPLTNQPEVGILNSKILTDEAIIALDINKLDREFSNDKKKQDAKLFYETLDKIDKEEGREAALKFLEANAYTGLKQEFWDNLITGGGIINKLEAFRTKNPDKWDDITNSMFNIKLFTHEIKNLIKTHNKKNNPAEVDTSLMSDTSINTVKQLQERLRTEIQAAKTLMGEDSKLKLEEEGLLTGVSEVNESYKNELKAQHLYEEPLHDTADEDLNKANQELFFAKSHMTDYSANSVENDRLSIEQFIVRTRTTVSKNVERILDDLEYSVADISDPHVQAQVLRQLARRNVLPYFKRYTSEGYTQYMDGLETTPNLADYLQNGQAKENAYIEISPNPTFFDEQENEQLNPNYNKEFKGGYLQPKLGNITLPKDAKFDALRALLGDTFSFRNQEFNNKFGQISNGVSSQNNKLYQAYLATLKFNEEALEAMNIGGTHNQYLLPQIRKRKIQRFAQLTKGNLGQNVKNFVKDALSYTEDDMVQGETAFGTDIKVIPKMYINKLENPEDISTDLFFSLALRAKEAYSRESKVKHYGDLMSIFDKISTREINGKDPKVSNTYKMMKSAIDYNLFGIKETVTYPVKTPFGTIDLTKLARMLLGFVKFRNLGLNIVIPITSMLTGEVTRKMETFTGEFIDRRSQMLGTKEFRRIAMNGMQEIGKINTEAKINVLGQYFKAFDMNESYDNSNYGKFLRFLPRMGMMLHAGANYSLYAKTLLGVLHDFRVVDGKMINKTDFIALKKKEGVSIKDANTEWRTKEDTVMYNYLVHDKNSITWDRDALRQVLLKEGNELSEEELSEAIEDMYMRAQKHSSLVNSLIDGQIPEEDRVLAQRHYLLSYFMTHRGWLSIAIARRFKNRHLNFDTQLVEEGTYRSVYGYLGAVLKEARKENMINFFQAFKSTWNDPTGFNEPGISDKERQNRMVGAEVVRKNMRRVAIETGILASIMLLSLALRGFADDEDNEDLYALQMANYLTFRTINELSSVQLNISSNMLEAIEGPFVGMNTVKNFADVGHLFSGDEVKHGSYRGMSERSRWITKMTPGMKQYFDLQNMNQTYETYKFYNSKNFSLTPVDVLFDTKQNRGD